MDHIRSIGRAPNHLGCPRKPSETIRTDAAFSGCGLGHYGRREPSPGWHHHRASGVSHRAARICRVHFDHHLSGISTFQVVRAHLTEPGNDSLTFANDGAVDCSDPRTLLGLEPSRNAIVTDLLGVGIEIHDWSRSRSVVVKTTGGDSDNIYVRMFRE